MTDLHIGDEVINFGQHAIVIGFHSIMKDPILQDADGLKWIANPALCTPAQAAWQHKDGLVVID